MSTRTENSPGICRFGSCEICGEGGAKYKCPKCGVKTCSLNCVQKHKTGPDPCDGVRKKSEFVPLDLFEEKDFLKDYSFMESAFQQVDQISRDNLRHSTTKGENAMRVPPRLTQLMTANKIRGCRFLLLPPHFQRRRENSTYLDFKSNRIYWKVEWYFPHAKEKTIISEKFDEKRKLWDFLSKTLFSGVGYDEMDDSADPFEKNDFFQYKCSDFDGITVLLKIEGIQKDGRSSKFRELEAHKSLRANLRDNTVVEHPIIYVILKSHLSTFLQDDDEDIYSNVKSGPSAKEKQVPVLGLLSENYLDSSDTKEPSKKPSKNESENSNPLHGSLVPYGNSDSE